MLYFGKWLASKFRREEPPPVGTGTVLDYRKEHQYWGHACALVKKSPEELFQSVPIYRGSIFAARVSVGDQIRFTMQSGREAFFMVKKVERCRDPADMYFIEAYPVAYG